MNERLERDLGAIVTADFGDRFGELRPDLVAAHGNRQLDRDLAANRHDLSVTLPIRLVVQIRIFDRLAPRQQFDISARRQGQ